MLMPKKVKHRKWQKRRIRGNATSGNTVAFGQYGLQSQDPRWITARQIEATRKVISKHIAKGGKYWIRIFPDRPVTAKGAEVPMGKGKGAVDHYVAVVKPGTILFEIEGVSLEEAKRILKLAAHKMPVRTKVVSRI